jgi:hypothetical protein
MFQEYTRKNVSLNHFAFFRLTSLLYSLTPFFFFFPHYISVTSDHHHHRHRDTGMGSLELTRGGEAAGGDIPFITGISEALLKVRRWRG